MADQQIQYDAEGYAVLRRVMQDLINTYEGMDGDVMKYEQIGEDSGIAFYTNGGALVSTEKKYISGKVVQDCRFPFYVVYRASAAMKEKQKLSVMQFLDELGEWLRAIRKKPSENAVEGKTYFPTTTDGRTITKINTENPYSTAPTETGTQDFVLPVTVEYTNVQED